MNEAGKISAEIDTQYAALSEAVVISPNALAARVFSALSNGLENKIVAHAGSEHIKEVCRKFLARHKDKPAAAIEQSTLDLGDWDGQLQDRYPGKPTPGAEPRYVLREHLSPDDRAWNVARLRKAGRSLLKHADALEAEGQVKGAA